MKRQPYIFTTVRYSKKSSGSKCHCQLNNNNYNIYKPESCLENDNYKLYFDRTVLTDIHIQHNRPDIIIFFK
jgi:hypothetical protein